jgi:hypothetical protein
LPALRDHEREHFIAPFCGEEISGKNFAPEKRQGRMCGLAWGGEVTPLGINCIALVFTLVRYRRA